MYLLYQGVYNLQILHTASLVGQDYEKIIAVGVQLTYIKIQDYCIKVLLRYTYMYLLHQGVYTLQILHTASLVGQNWEKINVISVQLMHIMIQDRKTVKKNKDFHKYQAYYCI